MGRHSGSAITAPQMVRLAELARAGLSDRAVAAVLNLDTGSDVNRHQVRYYRLRYSDVRGKRRRTGFDRVAR